jgi:hypothetical protein
MQERRTAAHAPTSPQGRRWRIFLTWAEPTGRPTHVEHDQTAMCGGHAPFDRENWHDGWCDQEQANNVRTLGLYSAR